MFDVEDVEDEDEQLTLHIVHDSINENYSTDGNLGILINKDFNSESGSKIIVPIYIKDSENLQSAIFECEIEILPVNDSPYFLNLGDIFISEEETYEQLWIFDISPGADNEDQDLSFFITFDNQDLVASSEFLQNGQLIINPTENAYGETTFDVYIDDSEQENNQSAIATYTLTIESVNDAPNFNYIESYVIDEDSGIDSLSNWAFNINPGGGNGIYKESDQILEFVVEEYNPIFFETIPSIEIDEDSQGMLRFQVNENVNGETIIAIRLKDYGDNKLDDNYTENDGENISDLIYFILQINQINDPPVQFSLFSDLRDYQENETTFYTEDEAIYFRYPYQPIYVDELNNPKKLRFEWEWIDSLDIDIYENINQDIVMSNIYYRLEAVETENPTNIIILADSLIYNMSNSDINYEVDNGNNIVRIDLDLTIIEGLDLSGNTSYNWRVIAQNYQEDYKNSDPELVSENSDYLFFIDLTLPVLDVIPFFDDIFLEHFDLYMLGSERFVDFNFDNSDDSPNRPIKLWVDYGNDDSNEEILFPEEIDELNYIYSLTHDFINTGDIRLSYQMRDKVENINENSEIISIQAIDPSYDSEINFFNELVTLSIPKNSTNIPVTCVAKKTQSSNNSNNLNMVGNIVDVYPENLYLDNKINLSFDLNKLNTNYDSSKLAIYTLENNCWILSDTYIINNLLISEINQFGSFVIVHSESHSTPTLFPDEYILNQNYPNPFNPSTTIEYYMPDNNYVELNIYNIKGEQVKNLYQGYLEAGYHSVIWDGQSDEAISLASGIYIVSFKYGNNMIRNKMVKIK